MKIRAATIADRSAWLRLRRELWPDYPAVQHAIEMGWLGQSPAEQTVLVIDRDDGRLGGFAEVAIRASEGDTEGRVAYLDAWYVEYDLRAQGWGRRLVAAAEAWAAEQGVDKLGSNAPFDNQAAIAAYKRIGFQETGRLVHFVKPVGVHVPESASLGD